MTEQSKSPVYKKKSESEIKVQLTFPEAIKQVIAGNKITKLEWGNTNIYGLLKNGHVQIYKEDGKFYDWIINDGDLLGEDWIVLGPSGEIN